MGQGFKYICIFFLLFSIPRSPFCQNNKADSLLQKMKVQRDDTNKVKTLYELCRVYYMQNNSEKLLQYAVESKNLCEKIGDKKGLGNALRLVGTAYSNLSDYPNAIDYHLQSLKIFEELGMKIEKASAFTNIGLLYEELGDYDKAMEYQLQGLKIKEELNDREKIANSLSNIGNIYAKTGRLKKALDYQLRSYKMREEFNDKDRNAISLSNIGSTYADLGDYPNALDYQLKALKLFKEVGNRLGEASSLGSLGNVYLNKKQYALALENTLAAVQIAKEINDFYIEKDYLNNLHAIYKAIGNNTEALKHYERYVLLKDSIFKEDNQKQIMRKQMNYEFDKKEAVAKVEQEKKDQVFLAQSKQQRLIIYTAIGGFLLVLVFSFFMYNRFRITQKQKKIIEEQKILVDGAYESLHEKNKEVMDSIMYARRIQSALLPNEKYIDKQLNKLKNK